MKNVGVIDIDGTITNLDFFKLTNKINIEVYELCMDLCTFGLGWKYIY